MNDLTEETIEELQEFKFFIPSHQRGYRWKEQPHHYHPSRKIKNQSDNVIEDSLNS